MRVLVKKWGNSASVRIPEAGDIVWLQFTPQAGHEQAGHRPALVLSPASYNGRTGLMLCCPLSSQVKGYPFEVLLASKPPSVVLADQIKSLDWQVRKAKPKGKASAAPKDVVREMAQSGYIDDAALWLSA